MDQTAKVTMTNNGGDGLSGNGGWRICAGYDSKCAGFMAPEKPNILTGQHGVMPKCRLLVVGLAMV